MSVMRARQIDQLVESMGLSWDEVRVMPPYSRVSIGLPPVIPQVDGFNSLQIFADNYLPRWKTLRRIFGLDQEVDLEPPFQFDEPDLGRNYSWYSAQLQFELNRRSVYHLVEEMDNYDLVSSSLDIYAEEATQTDSETGRAVWIESPDERIKKELMKLLDRLQIEDRVFGIVRSMCKYGDDFEQVIASQSQGIVNLEFVQPQRLTRIENRFGILQGFAPGLHTDWEIRDPEAQKKLKLSRPYDFIHFRIQSSRREMRHGESILMAARRVWRQLKIIEDSLVLYRLNRATDKDIYYIDVGNQSVSQQWQTVHRFRRQLRKKFWVNPSTGQMRQQYDPRTADEDLYIPITKDSKTRVERLQGANTQGDIYDVEHFRDKFFAAVKIPKSFMGYEEDVNAKATLVSQDIRFARTIKRIQRAFRQGMTLLCKIHLALIGYEEKDMKFKVRMAPINFLDDLARAELYDMRHEVAMKLLQLAEVGARTDPESGQPVPGSGVIQNVEAWSRYVLQQFLGFSDEELDYFTGKSTDRTSGTPPSMRDLKTIADDKELVDRRRLIREAISLRRDDEDIEVFDPIPTTEKDKETIQEIYDLEEEERKLQDLLGGKKNGVLCPSCSESSLNEHLDKSGEQVFLNCPSCGFVAFSDPNPIGLDEQ